MSRSMKHVPKKEYDRILLILLLIGSPSNRTHTAVNQEYHQAIPLSLLIDGLCVRSDPLFFGMVSMFWCDRWIPQGDRWEETTPIGAGSIPGTTSPSPRWHPRQIPPESRGRTRNPRLWHLDATTTTTAVIAE